MTRLITEKRGQTRWQGTELCDSIERKVAEQKSFRLNLMATTLDAALSEFQLMPKTTCLVSVQSAND
jgi:hypothetical protein